MQIEQLYKIFQSHPRVTTDSRNVPPHSIFFALKGDKFDGNDYILQTLEAGADYAVGERCALSNVPDDARIIQVDNVLQTLQDLANYHRKQMPATVIGITGTNGKTTTKELIAAALSFQYRTLYTQGNLNNHIGVPLTLLQITPEHQFAVIEMGANHPGEIQALCHIAEPDFGLITNVGKAHLEGFGSFEGVVKTKTELYAFLSENGGTAFANLDNLILKDLYTALNRVYYGTTPEAFIHGHITASAPTLALEWNTGVRGVRRRLQPTPVDDMRRRLEPTPNERRGEAITTQLVGAYNFENVLAAICVASCFNVPDEKINRAISEYNPTNNRSQQLKTAHNDLIVDAYNANPSSMQAALDNFNLLNVTPKMVILGEMRELGKYSAEEHQKIIAQLQKSNIDKIFLVGDNFSLSDRHCECNEAIQTSTVSNGLLHSVRNDGMKHSSVRRRLQPTSVDDTRRSVDATPNALKFFATTDELITYLQHHPVSGYHILIKGSRGNQLEKVIPSV
ncbi:UDP-N-acetylmuramoyl-tripeptide--D-alanyl-D-alanine ligase [Bacteroidia bacterium]|nr:UDP-N-acetylmuramoyl-tripeptide--D-alanyl-D-alanine ligase [Bacteroidia bacterium]